MHVSHLGLVRGAVIFTIGIAVGFALMLRFNQVLLGTAATAISFIIACIVLFRTIGTENSSTLPTEEGS